MRPQLPAWLATILLVMVCLNYPVMAVANAESAIITFGSCLRQWQPQPVWRAINALSPDAFIFLGDNVYSDVGRYRKRPQPARIGEAYADLAASREFRQFRHHSADNNTALFATWDDHDYGINDGGADYPFRLDAKHYFQQFFQPRQLAIPDPHQPGVYQSYHLAVAGLDLQLILLDTRSFRSPLRKDPNDSHCPRTGTVANRDPAATILGETQWQWLAVQLEQPADLRLIASSIQVLSDRHCFEKWANFPAERARLLQLIQDTRANGVVFISGDRHLAEIARQETAAYPLYEITASGLNSAMGLARLFREEDNPYRIGKPVYDDNFGAVALRSNGDGHWLDLRIYTARGELAHSTSVALADLTAP